MPNQERRPNISQRTRSLPTLQGDWDFLLCEILAVAEERRQPGDTLTIETTPSKLPQGGQQTQTVCCAAMIPNIT